MRLPAADAGAIVLDRQKRAEADSANGIGIGSFKDSSRWSATKEAKWAAQYRIRRRTFQNLSRILNADGLGTGFFR